MKLSFILLVITLQVSAKGYSQRVFSMKMENVELSKVLEYIEKNSDYKFLFNARLLRKQERLNVNLEKADIGQVMNTVLTKPLGYKFLGDNLIAISGEDLTMTNAVTVKGRVTDEKGAGIPGVTVKVEGTAVGTTTTENGSFELNVTEGARLVFSAVGFLTAKVDVKDNAPLTIVLKEDTKGLNEIVVVGYGTVKKSDLTGAVSSISAEKITQVNAVSNIAQALQGQAAGVQVNQRSGQPGEYVFIKVRGTNSIAGGNDPLYVVDGLPLEGLSAQLNPADIDKIEVLKDASATAIYGSRGANGVIMITTKKGKTGKAQVTYDGYYGIQQLRKKIDLINAKEFAQLQNEVAKNDGKPMKWTDDQIAALGEGTDWQDEVYRTAPVQNHQISVSGGNENTKYYTSFGYFDQKGIILNSGFKRISFRVNLDQKINDRLDFNTSLSIQHSKYLQAVYTSADGGGGIPFTTMVIPPTQGIYNPDGTYTRFTGVSWGETNPVGISKELYNPSVSQRIIGNVALNYALAKGLKLRLTAGVDKNDDRADYYAPSNLTIGQPGGKAYKNYANGMTFINENLLNYTNEFGAHRIDALAGITYQDTRFEELRSGTGVGFLSDLYKNNNLGAAATKAQPSTNYRDNKLVSYLGRINYAYKGKYLLTVTGRYDGSSKFGKDNKFAFFPSGALSWRVSEEDFMQSAKAISNLKLRLSYGASGNQAIDPYQTLARLNNVGVVFDNQLNTGFVQQGLENSSLKWETTYQFDAGIDFGLFDERIRITADYYDKRTRDLLLNVTLPSSSGFGSVLQNVGAVGNKGFEFELTTKNIVTPSFNWTSGLTFSHNTTKVLDLGNDAHGNPITYKEVGAGGNWFPMILGGAMSQLYGNRVTGIYQTDAEAAANGESQKKAGDYIFQDTNGDKVVDAKDKEVLSHLQPKFTFGFNNSFAYKNFDLSILLVGSYGNDIVNEFRKYNITMNGLWTPTREAWEQRWKGPQQGNVIDKPAETSGSYIRDYANSMWVENGSYLRVRDITLGYTMPAGVLKATRLSGLRIYASAQNFLTITKYSGYDPEASWSATSINGWDRGVYPSTKSVTVGVKVNF